MRTRGRREISQVIESATDPGTAPERLSSFPGIRSRSRRARRAPVYLPSSRPRSTSMGYRCIGCRGNSSASMCRSLARPWDAGWLARANCSNRSSTCCANACSRATTSTSTRPRCRCSRNPARVHSRSPTCGFRSPLRACTSPWCYSITIRLCTTPTETPAVMRRVGDRPTPRLAVAPGANNRLARVVRYTSGIAWEYFGRPAPLSLRGHPYWPRARTDK